MRTYRAESKQHAAAAAAPVVGASSGEEQAGLREPLLVKEEEGDDEEDGMEQGDDVGRQGRDQQRFCCLDDAPLGEAGADVVTADVAADQQALLSSKGRLEQQQRRQAALIADTRQLPVQQPPAPQLQHQQPQQQQHHVYLPFWPVITLTFLTLVVAGSDIAKAHVPCGSWAYWAIVLSVVPPSICVTLVTRRYILRRGASSGDNIRYTRRNTILYPIVCSSAGVVAGLFGLGERGLGVAMGCVGWGSVG